MNMQKQLLTEVFKKAKKDSSSTSALGLATHIHEALDVACKQPITTDAIRGYYGKFQNDESFNIANNSKNQLALYVGYKNYNDYVRKNSMNPVHKKRYQFVVVLLVSLVIYFVYDATRKKCMIWQENQFVRIHCEEAGAKPLDQRLLVNFRKVQSECREDFFFNRDGTPNVWYYKKGKHDLELFTMPGEHPENGKTLDDITRYMVKEHLCEDLFR